ncbi:hypothetical protein E2C01_087201 [Portunus trituberculatus]|uniref:Uncharacterized protein n=1 Tax=Portunus trituberculatus TaxID=210409 RepID=A0A5B7JBA8_PORTR|nr:hypothetical protein [Portunus trituberculatus]
MRAKCSPGSEPPRASGGGRRGRRHIIDQHRLPQAAYILILPTWRKTRLGNTAGRPMAGKG